MSVRKTHATAGLIVAALSATPVVASEDAASWLRQLGEAPRRLSYDGVFVHMTGTSLDALRVVHKVNGGTVRERIYALNGAPREVIRDAERVWCYMPEKGLGVHEYRQSNDAGFPRSFETIPPELGRHYELRLGREDRIADRRARQLLITPRDEFRYGHELWADAASGLLLKSAILDSNDAPLEQYVFTHIVIGGNVDEKELTAATPKQALSWKAMEQPPPAADEKTELRWHVRNPPAGFLMSTALRRVSQADSGFIVHLVYSDGLAAVSVFVERGSADDRGFMPGTHRMGAMHAFGIVVDGHRVTVIGEVPARTVEMIGHSVSRKP